MFRIDNFVKVTCLLSSGLFLFGCQGGNKSSSSSVVDISSSSVSSASITSSSTASSNSSHSVEPSSSDSRVSSSAIESSSLSSSSSSFIASSSSLVSSSSSVNVSSSSSSMESGDIIPRTSCPKGPTHLQIGGGSWAPAFAHATDHSQDTVANFKDLMIEQPKFAHGNVAMAWALHKPFQGEQNPDLTFPLVIYLHGGAEARLDHNNAAFLDNRHAKSFFASSNSLLTAENQENKPAYIVAPFCDGKTSQGKPCAFGNAEWASNGYGAINAQLKGEGSPYGAAVEALVEQLIATQPIDRARIYVTGPSMGGGGSRDIAARRPDLIAAAVPLAGHPLSNTSLEILAEHKVPVWSHHGEQDNTNSYSAAKNAIESLAQKGGCAWQSTYIPSQNLSDDDPADSDPSDATHNIWARAYTNPELWDWVFKQKQPRFGEVVASSSSTTTSSVTSSSVSSIDNSQTLLAANSYRAPKASVAPVIDGAIDAVWDNAPWMEMSIAWIFEQLTQPDSNVDFSGKYKALWTEDHIYLLFDITDDIIGTDGQYWQQDTVEIFVDEDQSGGQHNQSHSAFAYHVNYSGDVVDNGGSIDGHITFAIEKIEARYIWEIKMEIYADHNGYDPNAQEAARVKLQAGKVMGFTPSYIDNDNNGNREHFMSSVNTPGHQNNEGYLNASVFGSLELVE